MEIILIDKIKNLGDVGDIVRVRSGYARNYLIPYGKAKFATEENRLEIEQRRAEYERHVSEERALAKERAEKLKDLDLTISVQAMEDGRLYGSVSINEVCELILQKCGVEVQKQEINFPEGQIRSLGSHALVFRLHSDVQVETRLQVVSAQHSSSDENTRQENPEDRTAQETPADTPLQENPEDRTAQETPADTPLQENPEDRTAQETSADTPLQENPEDRTAQETPADTPLQENPDIPKSDSG